MNIESICACPFCASAQVQLTEIDETGWAVICDSCGGIGPMGSNHGDAVEQWNTRHTLAVNLGLRTTS